MELLDDEDRFSSTLPPTARVQDIRRQWALHEDEALAHRLQNEEINLHYSGNRTRNAIVREDAPKAREEQQREEQEALEQRLRHLSLLQQQAEEDAKVAQRLAKKYEICEQNEEEPEPGPSRTQSSERRKREDLSLLGAACRPSTSSANTNKGLMNMDEEELRALQEQRDEELARKVQEELEQYEKDQKLALEAQDRELARMIYEKEKARLKRAKERARLKAEAAALNKSSQDDQNSSNENSSDTASELSRLSSKRTSSQTPVDEEPASAFSTVPPKIPVKTNEGLLGFKAHPKKLPPNPQPTQQGQLPCSSKGYSSYDEPSPPYMPIHGYNRSKISPSKRPQLQ